MSEIAPSLTRMQSFGALGYELSVGALSHQQLFPVPAKFAAVPVTAGVYFTAVLDGVMPISLVYLHLRQINGSQATIEARVAGSILENSWVDTAIEKPLQIFSEARDISGKVMSADLVCEAVIKNVQWDGKKLQLFAVGTQDLRPPRTLAISTILFLQIRSSGCRSIRFPVTWGLQAGDTITHPDISDFLIDSFSLTIQPKYKVIDATEAA